MTEGRALKGLQRGSQEALSWFIERYTPYVSTVIYNIIGGVLTRADVEEVASDVFFALWNHAAALKPDSVRGWLGAVARNQAKNKFRQAGNTLPLDDEILLLEEDSLEAEMERQELRERVQRAVLDMPWPERELFLRFYYYGQTVTEIAAEMEMNLSTVKTRLRRGRERLKRSLTDLNDEGGGYEA